MPPRRATTPAATAGLSQALINSVNNMTEIFGYPVDKQTRTIIIDLLVACVVIALIVLPSMCCQVSGPMMKPMDDWEKVIDKHRKELKLQEKERQTLLKKEGKTKLN